MGLRGRNGMRVSSIRWWELAPEATLAAGLGWFTLTEWSAATSALRSSTALALMALAGGAWLVGRAITARLVPWPGLRLAGFAVAALGVLAVVVLPAYDDTTVVEAFPIEVSAPTPRTAVSTPATRVAASPLELASAALHGIDHRASGTVRLYRSSDGTHLVGLESIDIQPGPDYDVHLVPGANAESPGEGTRLDDLRGNRGTQYYAVPAGVDLEIGQWTVLVWCERFDVPVAAATPA
jgi:hypothetical protein